MGLGKWAARKGSIGGTARWVAKAFFGALGNQIIDPKNFATSEGAAEETHKIVVYALNARFHGEYHPDAQEILSQYEEYFGPGLIGFTIAILNVEAEYMKNTEANRKMFMEVIHEELIKANVGEKLL